MINVIYNPERKGTGARTIPNNESSENQFLGTFERALDFNFFYLLQSIDQFLFCWNDWAQEEVAWF